MVCTDNVQGIPCIGHIAHNIYIWSTEGAWSQLYQWLQYCKKSICRDGYQWGARGRVRMTQVEYYFIKLPEFDFSEARCRGGRVRMQAIKCVVVGDGAVGKDQIRSPPNLSFFIQLKCEITCLRLSSRKNMSPHLLHHQCLSWGVHTHRVRQLLR